MFKLIKSQIKYSLMEQNSFILVHLQIIKNYFASNESLFEKNLSGVIKRNMRK